MSTLSTPDRDLLEQIDRTTDLRWQAVLHYLRAVETSGGKARLIFDSEPPAAALHEAAPSPGDLLTFVSRETGSSRAWAALPTASVAAAAGEWILHGWDGSEELWQVVAHYRYIVAVTDPDRPTEQVHVLLRLGN